MLLLSFKKKGPDAKTSCYLNDKNFSTLMLQKDKLVFLS